MWKHLFSNGFKGEQQNASSKNLILSVLNSTTTKREAKDYLSKYTNEPQIVNHCLLFIRHLQSYSPQTLSRLSNSIKRLRMLGLRPVCIIPPTHRNLVMKQSELLDKIITDAQLHPLHLKEGLSKSRTGLFHSVLSSEAKLFDGTIVDMVPIIKPYIYNEETASEYMAKDVVKFMDHLSQNVTTHIDKFFILNRIGGIPSIERYDNSHVFINLSQEYGSLNSELTRQLQVLALREPESDHLLHRMELFAKESEIVSQEMKVKEHLQDLQLMDAVLSNLSPSSTGLITPVSSAALSSDTKNPLVYNLLTDRSLISSSLPRFKKHEVYELEEEELEESPNEQLDPIFVTTVLKKGVNIKVFDFSSLTQHNTLGLPEEFYVNTKTPDLSSSLKLDLSKMKDLIAVSYTHLDVYKRQLLSFVA